VRKENPARRQPDLLHGLDQSLELLVRHRGKEIGLAQLAGVVLKLVHVAIIAPFRPELIWVKAEIGTLDEKCILGRAYRGSLPQPARHWEFNIDQHA
jgi:hypothetical protein